MQIYVDLDHPQEDEFKIFFSGCDFQCPYCNEVELLNFNKDFLTTTREVKKFIELNALDTITFTGGEPCLQRQGLLNLARYAKRNDMKTTLQTNGSKPETIKSLIMSKLIDHYIVDIKAPLLPSNYEKATKSKTFFITTEEIIKKIKETLKLLENENYTVNIPVVPQINYRKEDIKQIMADINPKRCTLSHFIPSENHVNSRFIEISSPSENFMKKLRNYIK